MLGTCYALCDLLGRIIGGYPDLAEVLIFLKDPQTHTHAFLL